MEVSNSPSQPVDKHALYEVAVQNVDTDLRFFKRIFKYYRQRKPLTLREDFCGTALLCCNWVEQGKAHTATGVDLDKPTLEAAHARRVVHLSEGQKRRVTLLEENVLDVETAPVDVVCALNFSYSVFKERDTLLAYFRKAREAVGDEGLFVIDVWGGPGTMEITCDKRRVEGETNWAGEEVPDFKYQWDQSYFNFIDNHIICHIHFKVKGQKKMKRAFTYDWRLWTLPELKDVLREAGFASTDMYLEGWNDDEEETDGKFRRRTEYTEMTSWVGYLVAVP